MERGGLNSIFFNEQRLRSGWRILIYFAVLAAFTVVGQLVASLLPPNLVTWVALLTMLVAALAAGWILLGRLDGRPPGALGFALTPAAPREAGWGTAVGALLMGLTALLIFATRSAHFAHDEGDAATYLSVLVGTFAFFALAAAWEEAVFRGYPFQVLVEGIGPWPAVVLSSVAFSALHAWNPQVDAIALTNIFIAGVLLAVVYLRTRSLWYATGVHLGWNWTMATLLDFPVSGLLFETPLYTTVPTGPQWWTGGAFGPEAGIAATLILAVGTLWLARTPRLRPAPEMRALRPIVDRRPELAIR